MVLRQCAFTFISRAWYDDSYTMAAKPIKSLELHYTMIQFLIMADIPWPLSQSNLWNGIIQRSSF